MASRMCATNAGGACRGRNETQTNFTLMIGEFYFPAWLQVALSLFNATLLLWLGLTVLLNAERRGYGVWLAGSGMLLGALFFAGHIALLFHDLKSLVIHLRIWWYGGWVALIALPWAWYGLMLWYGGFWSDTRTALHRRQRWPLFFTSLVALMMMSLLAVTDPRYLLRNVAQAAMDADSKWNIFALDFRVLTLAAGYPIFLVTCIALALDGLSRPAPSARLMGDEARRRARPWLLVTTLLLLTVSLMVASGLVWILLRLMRGDLDSYLTGYGGVLWSFDYWDAAMCLLIGAAVVTMGKAVVSYEIFTGKTLPRRGFWRQWRSTVTLAAAWSALAATLLEFQIPPVYLALGATALLASLLAVWSFRLHAERENYMHSLRPFVASQELYGSLLSSSQSLQPTNESSEYSHRDEQVQEAFRALCQDVLGVESAHLLPTGTLSPLVREGLYYPPGARFEASAEWPQIAAQTPVATLCVSLGEGGWLVPLWSAPASAHMSTHNALSLLGVLVLGPKRDGGLFAQEEMEIARTAGARLLDAAAGVALSQQLASLHRARLAQLHMADQGARRVLHDDILPQIHAAMLSLSAQPQAKEAVASLADAHRRISDVLRSLPQPSAPLVEKSGAITALRSSVDELAGAFDFTLWDVPEDVEKQARNLPVHVGEALFYAAREAVRNAARHGRGGDNARRLALEISGEIQRQSRPEIVLLIEDNGIGPGREREIFGEPSTSEYSNAGGNGLALHSAMLAVVGGQLAVEARPEGGTRAILRVPIDV
jgi:two-component sensor histidine kinase